MRALPLFAAALLACGCAAFGGPRLTFVSSMATQASWSLVVDDRARGGQVWIDGRLRDDNCDRVRSQVRCELRGLWPGGHSFELRVAGAVMKRTVLIGRPWPARLALVRVRSPEEAEAAAKAGADGIVVSGGETRAIVNAAHVAGTRALVWSDATALEWAGADGVVVGAIPPALAARFPEARSMAAITGRAGGPPEVSDVAGAVLALLDGTAIVPATAYDFLRERKRHAALQHGAARALAGDAAGAGHRVLGVDDNGRDRMTLFVNLSREAWQVHPWSPMLAPGEVRTEKSDAEEQPAGVTSY